MTITTYHVIANLTGGYIFDNRQDAMAEYIACRNGGDNVTVATMDHVQGHLECLQDVTEDIHADAVSFFTSSWSPEIDGPLPDWVDPDGEIERAAHDDLEDDAKHVGSETVWLTRQQMVGV